MKVPFFRTSLGTDEIQAVVQCLESGWLTTGPRTRQFEESFAKYVGCKYAVALNSCTAALHLALEAVGLKRGELVLVPTMTFAATAEVVRYFDATPVLVDCDPDTLCLSHKAAEKTLRAICDGKPVAGLKPPYGRVRAIIPMHYGGQMVDVDAIGDLAKAYNLAVIEDAAHTLPASYRAGASAPWRGVGTTAQMTCFSFYANKCITTGEGGMLATDDAGLAERVRLMSLHGLSKDAWTRYAANGSPYYEIVAAGFKYNLTDMAASLGLVQLAQADAKWEQRCKIASAYQDGLRDVAALELPQASCDRKHSWHLYSIKLNLERLRVDRATFIDALNARGVATSIHWMPLHLHRYYRAAGDLFPTATSIWPRLVSLPIFPAMTTVETAHVIESVKAVASEVSHAA